MKNLLICFLLFFISANSLFAQQSIGFSNPDSLQPLLDYRLPDWGYSNFYLDFDANGDGFDRKTDSDQQVQKSGSIGVAPVYNLYRESEKRIFRLNTRMVLSYNRQVNKSFDTDTPSEPDTRDSRTGFVTILNFSSGIREYLTEQSFFYGQGTANLRFNSDKSEEEENGSLIDKQLIYDRTISFIPRIGYGFGRIRNVNPVIRAVRLKERADELGNDLDFNNQDILRAADQFILYDGYQQTYDRPTKYFWGDMNESTGFDFRSLDTFDMLYLTDVLDEAIGSRREGWEVIGGMEFNYLNRLRRDEDQMGVTSRSLSVNKEIGGFLNGRWYKNTSLKQQWGLFGEAVLSYPIGEDEQDFINIKRNFVISSGVQWLWNITDRILFHAFLNESYRRNKVETEPIGGGITTESTESSEWTNNVSLATSLNFFIENQTLINITALPYLMHFGNTKSENQLESRIFNWGLRLSLRYYFSRNLY